MLQCANIAADLIYDFGLRNNQMIKPPVRTLSKDKEADMSERQTRMVSMRVNHFCLSGHGPKLANVTNTRRVNNEHVIGISSLGKVLNRRHGGVDCGNRLTQAQSKPALKRPIFTVPPSTRHRRQRPKLHGQIVID